MSHEEKKPPRLTPLQCPSCRAPVPLVDAARATCPFCGAGFDVPPDYRALCAAEAEQARVATAARALFRQLGRPPRLVYRWLAGWFSPAALAVGVFPASFIAGVFVVYGGAWLAQLVVPVDLLDVAPEAAMLWASVAAGLVLCWAGALVGVAGTRRAVSARPLQAALAAKPPDREGGNALCRLCGAPLAYGAADLGVRCAYCACDNLLRMPPRWVRDLEKTNANAGAAIESVAEAWRAELARVGRFRVYMGLGLVVPTLLSLAAFSTTIGDRASSLSFAAATRGDGGVVVVTATQSGGLWYRDTHAVAMRRADVVELDLETTGPYCSDDLCRVYVRFPGVRGERWSVSCAPGDARVDVDAHFGDRAAPEPGDAGWRDGGGYGARVAGGRCDGGGVDVDVTRTAWHLVGVALAGGAAGRPVHVALQRRARARAR